MTARRYFSMMARLTERNLCTSAVCCTKTVPTQGSCPDTFLMSLCQNIINIPNSSRYFRFRHNINAIFVSPNRFSRRENSEKTYFMYFLLLDKKLQQQHQPENREMQGSKNDFWSRSKRPFSVKQLITYYSGWKIAWGSPRKPQKSEKVWKPNHPSVSCYGATKPGCSFSQSLSMFSYFSWMSRCSWSPAISCPNCAFPGNMMFPGNMKMFPSWNVNRRPAGLSSLLSRPECAKIPKTSEILDLQDLGSEILQDLGSYISIFSWDLRYLGSCHGNIAVGC